jgi:hypothetical protein
VTRRISVAATVRDAYAFLGAQLGGIIAVIWLPMVLVTVAQFFTFWRCYNDFINALASGNAGRMGPALLMLLGYVVAKLLLMAVACGGVVQLALGTRPAPALFHVAFGPVEGRLFRAFCGLAGMLLLTGMTILFAANVALVSAPQLQLALSGLMMLAILAAGLLLAARFLLLAPAIAANEPVPVLQRAWRLSAGNLWPMAGALVALFLPLALFFVALEAGLGQKGTMSPGGTPQLQMIAAIMHAREILPLTCGLSFFFSPVLIGLFVGASVSAWRALKDEPSLDIAV